MKCVSLLACLFVLLLVSDHVHGNLSDFFGNLPSELSKGFSSAWNTVVAAVKRPVRIKRLGHGRKRKTTSASTTLATTTTESITIRPTVYSSLRKLILPVLSTPKWNSLEDWENIQKPRLGLHRSRKGSRTTINGRDDELAAVEKPLANMDDENDFGPLMFI